VVAAACVIAGTAVGAVFASSDTTSSPSAPQVTKKVNINEVDLLVRRATAARRRRNHSHSARTFSTTQLPDSLTAAALGASARAAAAFNNDAAPTDARVYTSTLQKAAAAEGDGARFTSDEPVYVLVIHGHFVGFAAHVRPGAALPRGSTMIVLYDASNLRLAGWSIGPTDPDSSYLGSALRLF
jgi:hypothetical protein